MGGDISHSHSSSSSRSSTRRRSIAGSRRPARGCQQATITLLAWSRTGILITTTLFSIISTINNNSSSSRGAWR